MINIIIRWVQSPNPDSDRNNQRQPVVVLACLSKLGVAVSKVHRTSWFCFAATTKTISYMQIKLITEKYKCYCLGTQQGKNK